MWHPRVRFKSYRTRVVRVWYDLNLIRGNHRFYYLAPFTVIDSFSHTFLPCQCLFTVCVVWRINLRTVSQDLNATKWNKTRFSFYNFKEVQNNKVNKLMIDSTITKSCTFNDVCLFFSLLSIVSIFAYVEKI